MITVNVPGIGIVQVDSEESLPALEQLLTDHLEKGRKKANEPDKMLTALEVMNGEIRKLLNAVVKSIGNIKAPEVKVAAPIVNVETPEIKVSVPEVNVPAPIVTVKTTALKPIKEVEAKNIKFDVNTGRIKTCKFVVIR